MQETNVKKMISKVFEELAQGLETGNLGPKVKVGITVLGSEHGPGNIIKGAEDAQKKDGSIEVVLIGPACDTTLTVFEANTEEEQHKKMELLLDAGEIQACVTMHYNFPIGVSTVGRVVTPGVGKEMFLATTTGTSSSHRVEGMVKNALYGIITAKACGIPKPTVGVLNVDGARQVERALRELKENGYELYFNESMRADGGAVMRGNDLLTGTPDVMITDSLTGNLLMKMFSSYTTGGSYEALGYGYGPGIGEDYHRNILILSRASGMPVVSNAISFGATLAKGRLNQIAKEEFQKANKAGYAEILASLTKEKEKSGNETTVQAPPKEVVTATIAGLDILELEDAVQILWKNNIYAESGMGCTGPMILVSDANFDKANDILKEANYI